MKMGKRFNQMSLEEYFEMITHHKEYADFNVLGLYRSLRENELLTLKQKIEIREFAHKYFQKSFDFLQLKDPKLYFFVSSLGLELTVADENQLWKNIKNFQQKSLADKRIKHRNFGDYSKHNCGYDHCPLNGVMIKAGSYLNYGHMKFDSDKNRLSAKVKSKERKKDRKKSKQIIDRDLLNG